MIGFVSKKTDVLFLKDSVSELSDKIFQDLQNLIVALKQTNNSENRYTLFECDGLLLTFTRYRQHNIDTLGYRLFIQEVVQFIAIHSQIK